jgi:Ca2+-binding RTX toxin-like protein
LIGGIGADILTGGAGNDTFVYNSTANGGDTIKDFSRAVGNHDIFWINAAGFGGGLVDGSLNANQFQVSANHVALNANVRFIFDSSDNSLWFDANGSANGGQTMLADLQAGATVGITDIFLI